VAFWHRCHENTRRKLEGTAWERTWKAEIDADDQLPLNKGGIRIEPRDSGPSSRYLYYRLNHRMWARECHLDQRLYVEHEEHVKTLVSPEMEALRKTLHDDGFKETPFSVGWRAIKRYPSQDAFILEISERENEVAAQGVDVFWSTFERTVGLAENVNAWLRQRQ